MLRAQLVIFRVGRGDGLWWEIEEAMDIIKPEKIIFLIPDDDPVFQNFRQKLQRLIPHNIPDFICEEEISTTIEAILYFGPDRTPYLSPLKDAGFRMNLSQPLKPMLRIALKPVYNQLNLRWTPPPVTPRLIMAFIFAGSALMLFSFLIVTFRWLELLIFGVVLLKPRGISSVLDTLRFTINQFKSPKKMPDLAPQDPHTVNFYKATMAAWSSGKLSGLSGQYEKESKIAYQKFIRRYNQVEGGGLFFMFTQFPPLESEFLITVGDTSSAANGDWFVLTNQRLIQKDGRDSSFKEVILSDVSAFEITGIRAKSLVFKMKSGGTVRLKKSKVYPSKGSLSEAIKQANSLGQSPNLH